MANPETDDTGPFVPTEQAGDDIGGDWACWADRVCPECGRLAGRREPEVCEACGADFP